MGGVLRGDIYVSIFLYHLCTELEIKMWDDVDKCMHVLSELGGRERLAIYLYPIYGLNMIE